MSGSAYEDGQAAEEEAAEEERIEELEADMGGVLATVLVVWCVPCYSFDLVFSARLALTLSLSTLPPGAFQRRSCCS